MRWKVSTTSVSEFSLGSLETDSENPGDSESGKCSVSSIPPSCSSVLLHCWEVDKDDVLLLVEALAEGRKAATSSLARMCNGALSAITAELTDGDESCWSAAVLSPALGMRCGGMGGSLCVCPSVGCLPALGPATSRAGTVRRACTSE